MTALQILEKLGADASFGISNLSEDENASIDRVLSKTIHFNASQTHHFPEPDEKEEDEKEKEEPKSQ